MASDIINKWFTSAKRFLFKYKDGFFLLPIMANSPKTTIDSLSKMPFVKHNASKKHISSKNPFLNADIYYQEIDNGLWYLHAEAEYKENIHYNHVYNKTNKSDYYQLFLEISRLDGGTKKGLVNGIPYSNCTWVLLKPKTINNHCRFKDSKTASFCLYMDQSWVDNVLSKFTFYQKNNLDDFFASNSKLLMFSEDLNIAENIENRSNQIFKNSKKLTPQQWNNFTKDFLNQFLINYKNQSVTKDSFSLSQINRTLIIQTEKYLLDNINGPFPSIEAIANKIGISPTKLKKDFKTVFGDTIFQYYRKQQLESAKHLLQRSTMTVKEISSLFGYSNSSKLSAAYKEHFGYLPSKTNEIAAN